MNDAIDNGLVGRNPCNGIKLPRAETETRQALSAEEATRLLSCLLEETPSPGIVCTPILLECGLRKGEALGLSWRDYDSSRETPTLRIAHQFTNDRSLRAPKSRMSRRTISVNGTLSEYLARWKTIQRETLAQLGIAQDANTPIVHAVGVTDARDGKRAYVARVDGHNYSRWFRDFCVDNGFGTYATVSKTFVKDGKLHVRGKDYRGLVPHALCHTQATLLIGAGADVKTVQARLGHASPSTTLSIYAHSIEANDVRAAEALERILSGEGRRETGAPF